MEKTNGTNSNIKDRRFNKEWHMKHLMPKKATTDQRIKWHIAHHESCNCRDIPESIKKELKKRK